MTFLSLFYMSLSYSLALSIYLPTSQINVGSSSQQPLLLLLLLLLQERREGHLSRERASPGQIQ